MDQLRQRVKKVLEKMSLSSKQQEARSLETEAGRAQFWNDREKAASKMKRLTTLQTEIDQLEKLDAFIELAQGDAAEIEQIIKIFENKLYLSGPYDPSSALVSIHSGQGGVEAMDWAEMIFRMYSKFASSKGWKIEEVDYEPGSEAGIKTVTFEVLGDFTYGLLKNEAGVHRLVRKSPFNADHLRQTSFALVEVLPVVEESITPLVVREEDLEWDFFRSGGHGGQNVNKVSSAVRLKHIPSGIIITSQKERDQSRNREIAIKILKAKLLAETEEKKRQEEAHLKGQHLTPGWGNQIRSYVLHPYHLVKDLRTDYEESDSDAVLEGHLDGFIESELHFFSKDRPS